MSRPLAVAITGGISAGKSTALESFRRHGAATVSSDEIVHHLLKSDPEVRRALVERFGQEILGEDGTPDELDAWVEALMATLSEAESKEESKAESS